jgi:hypothetical protein
MAYVPITRDTLAEKRWFRHTSMAFAKNDTVAPIFLNELPIAIQAMPVAFIKQGEGFVLVVVMGLMPGQNLCVTADGKWNSEYMPVTYRSSPFELMAIQEWDGQQTLCIDENCITDGQGEPFFDENGEIAPAILDAFQLVQQFNSLRSLTKNICDLLAGHNLIKPWSLVLNDGITEQSVGGLYQVDEEAFNALSDEVFLEIRRSHALPLIYSQLLSMQKITVLGDRLRQETTLAASMEKSRSTDTFNFGGL